MYVSDLKFICDLDLNTVLFEIKNPYRHAKNPNRCAKSLTGAQILQVCRAPVRVFCMPVRIFDLKLNSVKVKVAYGFQVRDIHLTLRYILVITIFLCTPLLT